MKAKRRLLFQILAVVLLVAIGYTMTIIGRGHTIYLDSKTLEYAYNIPVPRKMDNVIINLPGFLAGLPEEAYLSEFIPSPDEVAADETDVPSDDDFGMEDMGMGDESAAQ